MRLLDRQIRVEMNSHGGVVLHIPGTDLAIWNTAGGKWAITPDKTRYVKENGVLSDPRLFNSLIDALWAGMGWGDEISFEKVKRLGFIKTKLRSKNVRRRTTRT